jgi:ubiquinone/menaquinone biosynthesis C-methylase UbiE
VEENSSYFADASNPVEAARLLNQGRMITELMPKPRVPANARILDVACGPGEWLIGVAQENPQAHLIGIFTTNDR